MKQLHTKFRDPISDPHAFDAFYTLTGGHPYLVSRGFGEIAARPEKVVEFLANADGEDGPYGDHLRRYIMLLAQDEGMLGALRNFMSGSTLDAKEFVRLRAGGILSGNTPGDAAIRCELYKRYFGRHFRSA